MVRSFIAVDIPEEVKKELALLINFFQKAEADIRWAKTENLHLTLKFLGEQTDQQIEKIKQSLEEIAVVQKSFQIRLSKLGGFPAIDHPRVLWVGVEQEGGDLLVDLVEKIEFAMITLGFEQEEKSFSPHLTLGRIKSGKNLQKLVKIVKETLFSSAYSVAVNQLILYKSILGREGSVYQPLKKAGLSGT